MLRLGNREFAWGGAELGEMRDSNELLSADSDGDALRARLEADGVRLRHTLPPHACTLSHTPEHGGADPRGGGRSTCCSAT